MYAPDETTNDNRIAPGYAYASSFPGTVFAWPGALLFSANAVCGTSPGRPRRR